MTASWTSAATPRPAAPLDRARTGERFRLVSFSVLYASGIPSTGLELNNQLIPAEALRPRSHGAERRGYSHTTLLHPRSELFDHPAEPHVLCLQRGRSGRRGVVVLYPGIGHVEKDTGGCPDVSG